MSHIELELILQDYMREAISLRGDRQLNRETEEFFKELHRANDTREEFLAKKKELLIA